MGAQECQDYLFLRYGLELTEAPKYYDRCNAALSIYHALNLKRGCLVTARHNDLCDKVADLSGKAFSPNHVRNNLLSFAGCAVKRKNTKPARSRTPPSMQQLEATEQKVDVLIRDLW